MNVLRMVKLFGWENKMNERIRVKREEELVWVRWKQFLDVRPCFFRLLHAVLLTCYPAASQWHNEVGGRKFDIFEFTLLSTS